MDANGPCAVCKSEKELEVDHVDPNQKVSHRIWSWTKERRGKELEKCQVLCHVCHEAKTAMENRVARKDSKSKCRGVDPLSGGKWRARIRIKNGRIDLGIFDSEEDASLAYEKKLKEITEVL